MSTLFEWGFRLALVLPWIAIFVGVLVLLPPTRRRTATTATRRDAA